MSSPWVRVEHLASHILGRMAGRLPRDWERIYAHPIYLLETFVDPERFRGTKDTTIQQWRELLLKPATTEKTRAVLERAGVSAEPAQPAEAQTGRKKKGTWAEPGRRFARGAEGGGRPSHAEAGRPLPGL